MFWQKLYMYLQSFSQKDTTYNFKKDIGERGENAVAAHVKKLNMRILNRNWRHASLELDLVCEDSDGIIFIEVKTRKTQGMTSPFDGVNAKKRATLIKAATVWLRAHNAFEKPCRFAVATVHYTTTPTLQLQVEFHDNAFTASSNAF